MNKIIELITNKAYAAGDTAIPNPLGVGTFPDLLNRIIDFLFAVSIPIVSIMVIYGAFLILTGGGEEEKIKSGKNAILYAAIGFGIILISKGIAFVIRDLLTVR